VANIRTARRSGLVLRGGRNRRDTLWGETTTAQINIGSPSVAVLAFALGAGALALRPFTVVRHRLNWYARSDVLTGGEVWGAAIGGCVVSDQASAIGVTAVPTPITDGSSDLWYFYEQTFGRFGGTTVEEVGREVKIDSKAMRKVEDGEDLIIVLETPAAAMSAACVSVIGGRFLLKLH